MIILMWDAHLAIEVASEWEINCFSDKINLIFLQNQFILRSRSACCGIRVDRYDMIIVDVSARQMGSFG